MQKKKSNMGEMFARLAAMRARAMERLRSLGARMMIENGRQVMYIPGDVNLGAACAVDSYGTIIASRRHGHKQFLRAHRLGKFRKR